MAPRAELCESKVSSTCTAGEMLSLGRKYAPLLGVVGVSAGLGWAAAELRRPAATPAPAAGVPVPVPVPATPKAEVSASSSPWHYLAVYLTDESHRNLQAQLAKLGVGATHTAGRRVVVRSRLSVQDDYMYQPLYGERAAFRLKGLIRAGGAADLVVGTGRVSTVAGELKDADCEASITLYPNADGGKAVATSLDEHAAMDLATRLKRAAAELPPNWKGRLASQSVLGREHAAVDVSFTALSFADQVVVDGYICSSEHVDEKGGCGFDRASLTAAADPDHAAAAAAADAAAAETGSAESAANPAPSQSQSRECPVCQYMKGGPCKQQFLAWDACVQGLGDDEDVSACFPVTVTMMGCMRQHEYYDVMTANAEAKMAAASADADAGAAPGAVPEAAGAGAAGAGGEAGGVEPPAAAAAAASSAAAAAP